MNYKNLIYGKHAVIEALQSDTVIDKILISRDFPKADWAELKTLCTQKNIVIQSVPLQKIDKITTKNHQGIVGFIALINYYDLHDILMKIYDEGRTPLFLVLDQITDVRNFGAIARTALGMKADAIVIPKTNSVSVTPDAIKTSAGALLHLPVCKVDKIQDAIAFFKANGIAIYAADMHTQDRIFDVDFSLPLAFVMGAEDTGVSLPVIRTCDKIVKIPIHHSLDSYNVSVAAGMILYEINRQRTIAQIT